MTGKVKELVHSLDFSELEKLKKDLETGGIHLKKLIEDRLTYLETAKQSICAACGTELEDKNIYSYTLTFGPDDFRRKGSFCGLDCLNYFMEGLRKLRSSENQEQQ